MNVYAKSGIFVIKLSNIIRISYPYEQGTPFKSSIICRWSIGRIKFKVKVKSKWLSRCEFKLRKSWVQWFDSKKINKFWKWSNNMASIIPGYNYDIHLRWSYGGQVFIRYRQKDNKDDRWVSEFVEALRKCLEEQWKV